MNIGGTEIFLILLVALLLFGAKNLPKFARSLGKSVEEFRRAAREVSREVMNADQDDQTPPPRQLAQGTEPRTEPTAEPTAELATDAHTETPTEATTEKPKEPLDEGRG